MAFPSELEADAETEFDLPWTGAVALGTGLSEHSELRSGYDAEVSWILQVQIRIVELWVVG